MALFDITALLPGLKPARWRGCTLWLPDVSTDVGRRVVLTFFPGIDDPAVEDLGAAIGPIRVRGLVVGDDYVAQALALQAAFLSPGPGTLLHPWFGEMTVVVPPGGANVSLSDHELRVVRIDATFMPVTAGGAWGAILPLVPGATLSRVVGAISSLIWAARAFGLWRLGASSGVVLGTSLWSAAGEIGAGVAGVIEAACAASPSSSILAPAVLDVLAQLAAAASAPWSEDAPLALVSAVCDLAVPVAEAAIGAVPSATAPGPLASTSSAAGTGGWTVTGQATPSPTSTSEAALAPADAARGAVLGPRAGAALLMEAAVSIGALDAHGLPAQGLRLVARLCILAQATRLLGQMTFESRQDATAWATALDNALAGAADDVAALASAGDGIGAAGGVWQALADLRAALGRDMHEVIGRLPAVRIFSPPAPVSAWLLAQHFSGDDPADVVPTFDDLVRRNRVRHPGQMSGRVEVLDT